MAVTVSRAFLIAWIFAPMVPVMSKITYLDIYHWYESKFHNFVVTTKMNLEWPPWRFRLCSEQKKNSAWSSRMDAKAMTLHALISNCPSSRPNRLSHNYPRLLRQRCGKCNISNNNSLRHLKGIIGPEEALRRNPDWEVRQFFTHLECHPLRKTYMLGQFTGNNFLCLIICATIFQFFSALIFCHFWCQFSHTIYICL